MQELLVDPLTGEYVILAPARSQRPVTFRTDAPPLEHRVPTCPFCEGNEHETPPEVARIGAGAPDMPGWRVRVVPNKYPLVGDGVAGAHEVVILSPAHDGDLVALSVGAVTDSLLALRDRAAFHLSHGCAHVQPFVNSGRSAGASIEHPHAQLVALDFVPPRVDALIARFSNEAYTTGREHVVVDGEAVAWCPSASSSAFRVRIAVAGTGARFDEARDDAICALATTLHDTMRRVNAVLGAVPYNIVFETAPRDHRHDFRWWVDIVPRLGVAAGFEMGTGLWVNSVAPSDAAKALRNAT